VPILRQQWITRADLKANRNSLYVFGDNMVRTGRGGQASAMRGEPNAFGIPTKWYPSNDLWAFFKDADFTTDSVVSWTLTGAFTHLTEVLHDGYTVVIPTDGLGTGLSRLPETAPTIAYFIDQQILLLEQEFGINTTKLGGQ